MLLALNIFTFVLGFLIAGVVGSKPGKTRKSLELLLSNASHVFDALKANAGRTYKASEEDSSCDTVEIFTKAQVEEHYAEDTWQRKAYEHLKSTLLGDRDGAAKFPCPYATAGFRGNEHRYIFTHSEDPTEPRNIRLIANAMRAYLPLSHSLGPNTSLVIIHPHLEDKISVQDYHLRFWEILRRLRTCDLKSWPNDIPAETNSPRWAFCFDGVPWFPAALTPSHERRLSRYAPNFTIAMQPKWVFDNLFRTPEKRRAAVEAVRKLMPKYDRIETHPDLSAYGTEGTTEAHQYYLLDENVTCECPYNDMDK